VRDRSGAVPPVVDARDVLEHPRQLLSLLCDRLGVAFSDVMLSWPAGPRATDGVWAKHWYANVEKTTSFQPYSPPSDPFPSRLEPLRDACTPFYETLHRHRLVSA